MQTDLYGREWPLRRADLCGACRQPDNCGDCTHARLSDDDARALGATLPMSKDEILALALQHDPDAVWVSRADDENCLLVLHEAAAVLLDRVPASWEDPNLDTVNFTRVIFPYVPSND